MNTLTRRSATLSLLAGLALVFSLNPHPAKADVISVSPPRFELFGNPGDIVKEKLKVRNDGTSEVTYQTQVEDFSASGDDGGININEDPKAPHTSFSLARWMTVEPSSFTVGAGKEKVVDIAIKIPKTGEPGGHYASVQVKLAGSPTTGGGASVESKLNSLILLRVSGNITEKLTLDAFKTDDSYYQKSPINFSLRTKNEGNVHVAPTGTIVVTDIFNRKVAEIPLQRANVLPNSSRAIVTTWDKPNLVGKFTATLVANYGSGQQKVPLTSSTTFYVIPLSLIAIFAVALILLLVLITKRKSLKKILHKLTTD